MPSYRNYPRIDTLELKTQIIKVVGRQKAEKYFYNLKRLLSLKLSKLEFDKQCKDTLGKENIALHNLLIRSILSNACLGHIPPSKQTVTGNSRNTRASIGHLGDAVPRSPRQGRSTNNRDRRLSDRPSPLGPLGKIPAGSLQEVTNSCDVPRSREQQSAPEFVSIGSKALLEVISVEEGEEVEQVRCSSSVQSRSPVRPPLGIAFNLGAHSNKSLYGNVVSRRRISVTDGPRTCYETFELPDTRTLGKRLQQKLELEGLAVSVESVNVLNSALDVYIKNLIKPSTELARARRTSMALSQTNSRIPPSNNGLWQKEDADMTNQSYSVSLQDFRVAMEVNPRLLGGDWPIQLEKICLRSFSD